MIFEQAYFGGIRTHSCIASSIEDDAMLSELVGLTDKPHTLDKIKPYFSGVSIKNHFVFIKTIPVINGERTGIVFSHCIIVSEVQLKKIDNLKPLYLNLLSEPRLDTSVLSKIKINEADLITEVDNVNNPLVSCILKELLDNKKPVLLGYDFFISVIFDIWKIIPKFLRKEFTFKLSGNANDLSDNLPSLIYTPLPNEIRWQNNDFIILSRNSFHNDLSIAEKYLIDRNKNEFSLFILKYEIEIKHISDYRKIEKCYEYYKNWQDTKNIQELNKTIRVVANLFSKQNSGAKFKKEILHLFCNEIEKSSGGIIISIRNIKFNAYDKGFENISYSMNTWLKNLNKNYKQLPISEIADILSIYEEETNPDWWNENIESFIKGSGLLIDFHWQLWVYNSSFLYLSERLIAIKEESLLTKITRTSNTNLLKEFINYSANKKWFKIHAICSAKYYSTVKEAIEKHLSIIGNEYESFEYLIEVVGNREFFNYSTTTNNINLHKIAAGKAVIDRTLLNSQSIDNLNWQSIWCYTLQKTHDLTYGIANVQKLIFSFWDIAISGQDYNIELASFIAETDYGSVLEYSQHSSLWKSNIPEDIKSKMLNTTGISIVRMGQKFILDDFEDELKRILSNKSFIENILRIQDISIKAKIIFLQNINAINEECLIKLLEPNIKLINSEDAIFIGNQIDKYEWKHAVKLVRNYKWSNSNLNKTWEICKHHYSWMNNLFDSYNTFDIKPMDKKNKIFISYSSNDRNLRELFEQRLSIYLKSTKNKFDVIWTDKEIPLGGNWNKVIQDALTTSDIGILLVSPMFLGSDYSMGDELEVMLKKSQEEGYLIFPVLLRECSFQNNDTLSSIQFFKTYKSEYDVYELLQKNKLMPFDELAEVDRPSERLLNRYFQKLANAIDRAISI